MNNDNKIKSKDAITIGIFSALIVAVRMVFMILGGISPIVWFSSHFIDAIILGPIFMLLVTKIHKTGAIFMASLLTGLVFFVSSYMVTITCVVFGLLAELSLKLGDYKKKSSLIVAFILFSYGFIGDFLPVWITTDSYMQNMKNSGFDSNYLDKLTLMTSTPVIIAVVLSILIGSIIGGLLGTKLMKKHFVKAGIV